jgi:hypothetical protein
MPIRCIGYNVYMIIVVYKSSLEKETVKMTSSEKNLRTCNKGHNYYKSSDCPTCPICEQQRKPETGFLSLLSAPARRALENNGITSLQQLSTFSEKEILQFHGMGPASLPKLRKALENEGLSFR